MSCPTQPEALPAIGLFLPMGRSQMPMKEKFKVRSFPSSWWYGFGMNGVKRSCPGPAISTQPGHWPLLLLFREVLVMFFAQVNELRRVRPLTHSGPPSTRFLNATCMQLYFLHPTGSLFATSDCL